jgi:diguanylate cyclase (GGDEF)-like protein
VAGYRTEIVMSGRDAVERLNFVHPDIVLLDLSLPGVPGSKILERMRADQHLQSVPVVVVTAHAHIADSLAVEPELVLLKPVSLTQLSELVQRLRHAPLSMHNPPWDPITHLYNREFFIVRLTYSLERARQIGTNRFGVIFIDLEPFGSLRAGVPSDQVDIFLREIAGHLKTSLRPTDTVARAEDGVYLVLIEDLPDYAMPSTITGRIELDLGSLISTKKLVDFLHANIGLIVCSGAYGSVEEIMGDVNIARRLSGTGQARVQYERDMLRALRRNDHSVPRRPSSATPEPPGTT